MRVALILLSFIFIAPLSVFTQDKKTDSLLTVLNKSKDSARVDVLISLIEEYSDYDAVKAKQYAEEAVKLAEQINYKKGMARAYLRYGLELWYEGSFDGSIPFLQKSYTYYLQTDNKKKAATAMSCLGGVYKDKGSYDSATVCQFRALKIAEEIDDKKEIIDCYISLGNIYRVQKAYNKAAEYYKKGLELNSRTIKNRRVDANCNMGLGNVYYSQHYNDTALTYYLTSLKIAEEKLPNGKTVGDKNSISTALYNVGLAHTELGRYKEATPYYLRSLEIKKEQNDKMGQGYCFIGLGLSEFYSGNYLKAAEYQEQALNIAKEINALENMVNAYHALAKSYSGAGNHKKALENLEFYTDLKDSIFDIESKTEMAKMEGLYKTEKKDKEIISLEKEKRINQLELKQKRNLIYTIIGLSLLLITIIILFFTQRRMRLKEKVLREKQELLNKINQHQKELLNVTINAQEEERKRIAGELHDGLGGLLSTVKLNLDTYNTRNNKDSERNHFQQSVDMLDEVCNDLRTISHNMMPGALVKLGLIAATKDFISKLNSSGNILFRFEAVGAEVRLQEQVEIALFRIIQEASNNIIKHSRATKADIQLIMHDDVITLMIEDNGQGFDTSNLSKKQGIGLQNIESRITYLGGKLVIDSQPGKGTSLIAELPH
ncbi:MAG: histidine kinase [Bacteroidetes bacterium]|jgi:signal transduction histidine kinase/Tfp pilus assembly protein PilF|nr:histidine kinase [Bacteroidota bacterium]